MLETRIRTSRLIGADEDLVLHGGGNTSLKVDDVIYVKASGFNLDTIDARGFTPVWLQKLLDLLHYDTLSDTQMVSFQRAAMVDQKYANPSIEAILHALIPFKYVDHTHADAIVTISNCKNGAKILSQIYGKDYLIVPYVMPGFILAKKVYEMTHNVNWKTLKGIILLNHGIFTFDDDGMKCYEKMIASVKIAQDYLDANTKITYVEANNTQHDLLSILHLFMKYKGADINMLINRSEIAQTFASMPDLSVSQKGVLTPEHIIRTKRTPLILDNNYEAELKTYIKNYKTYFTKHQNGEVMLDPTPNWIVIKGYATASFAKTLGSAKIIQDINNHTMKAMLRAEQLGGYKSLSQKDSFAMEYWELEQAKLKK